MAMSEIHNANVPGWQLQLQQNMNHLFTNMEPGISWLRHNWLFQVSHPHLRLTEPSSQSSPDLHLSLIILTSSSPNPHNPHLTLIILTSSSKSSPHPHLNLSQDYEQTLHPYFPWSPLVVEKRPDVYPALPESRSGWWESKDLKLQTAADVAEHVCLRTEFQTLRRLPKTRAIAFALKSYVDPLRHMEAAPGAAAALGANLRRRYKGSFFYFALGRHQSQRALLEYLDSVATAGGVPVWKEVPDPWERTAVEDGTWAADADRAEMSGGDGVAVAKNVEVSDPDLVLT